MPTLLRWNGYRFYFWSREPDEPPHVHVDNAGKTAKIWLETVDVAYYHGFTSKEMRHIMEKVQEYREVFLEAWYDYFK